MPLAVSQRTNMLKRAAENRVFFDGRPTFMKKALIISGIALAVLVAAALIAPSFINWDTYRNQIMALAENATGRSVRIDGSIDFTLLPSPRLSAENVTVANVEGGSTAPFLELQALNLEVAVLPLLSGEIAVRSIRLDQPVFNLERLPDGRGNWIFTDGEEDQDAQDGSLTVNRLVLTGGRILYTDLANGQSHHLDAVNAELQAGSMSGPFNATGDLTFREQPVRFQASTGKIAENRRTPVSLTLHPAGQQQGISLNGTGILVGDVQLSARMRMAGNNAARITEALFRLAGVPDALPPLRLDHAYDMDANVNYADATLTLNPVSFRLGESSGNFVLTMVFAEPPAMDLSFTASTVNLDELLPEEAGEREAGAQTQESPLSGISLPGGLTLDADMAAEAVTYRGGLIRRLTANAHLAEGALRLSSLSGVFPGGSSLDLSGTLDMVGGGLSADGHISLNSSSARTLLLWAGAAIEDMPQQAFASLAVETDVTLTDETLRLANLTGQLDITDFSGRIEAGLGTPQDIQADLTMGRVNLETYLGEADSEEPLTFETLHTMLRNGFARLDGYLGRLQMDATSVSYTGSRAEGLAMDLVLEDDRLLLGHFEAQDFEGASLRLTGNIDSFSQGPRFNLGITAHSENPAPLIRLFGLQDRVDAADIAPLSLEGQVAGTLTDPAMDIVLTADRARLGLAGNLTGLSPRPQSLDMEFSFSHPNHLEVISRFDLPLPLGRRAQPVSLSGRLSGSPEEASLSLDAELFGGSFLANGQITGWLDEPGYDLALTASHPEIRTLIEAAGIALEPARQSLGALRAEADFSGNETGFSASRLRVSAGPASLQGEVSADWSGEVTQVTGAVRDAVLPFNHFLPAEEAGALPAARQGARWSDEPLDLAWMQGLNADLDLAADAVNYRNYEFSNASTRIRVRDGVLSINDLATGFLNGRITGQAQLAATEVPSLSTTLNMQEVALDRLLFATAAIRPATGAASMTLSARGEGTSQRTIIASLTGNASVAATGGVIRGINIPHLSERMGTLQRLPDFLSLLTSVLGGGETAYRNISTRISIEDGLVRAPQLTADIDGAGLSGAGEVNLPDWTMNAGAQISLTAHPEAPAIGVTIEGDVDNPAITYQTEDLQSYMASRLASQIFRSILGGEEDTQTPPDEDTPAATPGSVIFDLLKSGLQKKKDDGGGTRP